MEYLTLFQKYLSGGKSAGRQWRFNCPRCDVGGHSNGRHLWVNPVTGQWRCFHCEANPDGRGRGNAITFARMMGEDNTDSLVPGQVRDRPRYFDQEIATKVYTWLVETAALTSAHKEHLVEVRGFKEPERYRLKSTNRMADKLRKTFGKEELVAAGLFYIDDDSGVLVMHESIYPNRIIIPYVSGHEVTYFRSRNMGNAGMRPYLGPIGAGTNHRFWGHVDPKRPHDLIITEGEFKAIAADQYDFHIIAQPGMNAARTAVALAIAENRILESTICYDSQLKKPENVDYAAAALAREVYARSCEEARVFRAALPLMAEVDRGAKMDIDSHIVHCGIEQFRGVIFSAYEIPPGRGLSIAA